MTQKLLPIALSVFLGMGFACAKAPRTSDKPNATPEPEHYGPIPGGYAPLVTLLAEDGSEQKLEDLRGDVVLLNFWATWCGPCIEEMPSLQSLHEELADAGLQVVAVSVDSEADLAWAFAKENDLTLHLLFDRKQAAANAYQVRTIPITFLIDRDGKIVSKIRGTRDWTSPKMKQEVQDVLRQES